MFKNLLVALILVESLTLALTLATNQPVQRHRRQEPSCGVPSTQASLHLSRIFDGETFDKGAWPWMVALLNRKSTPPKFFCAGTLITNKKVVTAAHCIHQKYDSKATKPRDVLLIFGAYDLAQLFQPGQFSSETSEIILHHDWNPAVTNFDADIALLIPDDVIPFTKLIKPICLWETSTDPTVTEGYIAGWGLTATSSKDYEPVPSQLKVPIHQGEDCLLYNPIFTQVSSKRTICGGSKNGAGPCLGDSGSGLYIKQGDVFYLRAIVSSSILDRNQQCDLTNFALYTNVLKFKKWINDASSVRNSAASTCGIMSGATSTIQGGLFASKEIFPWTVVVYDSQSGPQTANHLKTGTLVSNRHVIVSAGSVSYFDSEKKNIAIAVSRIRMYFGVYNLELKNEAGVISAGVSKVIIHPSFKDEKPGQSKVAVLLADRTVEFSQQISPICLWPYREDSFDVDGKLGFAAGWGYDDSATYSNRKRYIQMKMETSCPSLSATLTSVPYSKFFCAKAVTAGTPCISDDPIYVKSGDKWFLRGLWWSAYFYQNFTCHSDKPTLYEDMSFYSSWIQKQIDS